ncbi:MAG: MBL fold metallo-hydrolase [Candidatus Moranbacteria bacterium]|nr:MBL fold metallo-hydrolase [Candidatus Moranbacteria bacterium]
MKISYIGHACFKIETKSDKDEKLIIYIDPFDKSIGLKPPKGVADLVLSTHDHFDHNYTKELDKGFFYINNPGEYSYKGVNVKGIQTYHDEEKGRSRGLNTVYVIENEKLKVCHLGDLGHTLSQKQADEIGSIDILMIPVGGTYTINPKQAVEIVKLIEPSIIIPMHFNQKDLQLSGLEEVEKFYNELGKQPKETVEKLNINANNLNPEETEVIAFNK